MGSSVDGGESFDLVIIGGGITGVAIAQFARAAGYSVCLLEQAEIGAQTSANSSKLIHGGLRYLESGQLGLVYKSLANRRTLLSLAPNLVKPIPFTIPVYQDSQRPPWLIRLGLSLYWLLSGFSELGRFRTIPPSQWANLGGIKQQGLKAVFQYWDAQTHDKKLTQAVASSAITLGAKLLTQAKCTQLTHQGMDAPQGCHWLVRYQLKPEQLKQAQRHKSQLQADGQDYSEKQYTLAARMVINAAGPWVNEVLSSQSTTNSLTPLAIDWVQGSHLVLDIPAPEGIFYLESHLDKRVIFVMPWEGNTLVGTTETLRSSLQTPITPQADEIDYLLQIYQHYFPKRHSLEQLNSLIIGHFCGVRVLPKAKGKLFNRSRDTLIVPGTLGVDGFEPRLLSIYGGKLTTFRDTAKQVLADIRKQLGSRDVIADVDAISLGDEP
ncbi:FAD dependent oxidoreductase [Shewanella denitrificans OS217]|uniref:FAD dependent oxidoreductase n=1 Tax=Shewanella denitrificans (strain OS217 / ATCC BAA-1090 / DSM 15013) TaxID=318161 RepID=Q12SB2_SHEDO|nr:FAD-dependent oxidoreductase [Shewanella denitrificans]ABE53664.1 FAD dependent oxidoreductase [Shewanella denitrificans OS217]